MPFSPIDTYPRINYGEITNLLKDPTMAFGKFTNDGHLDSFPKRRYR
jgi:hypothetical protein